MSKTDTPPNARAPYINPRSMTWWVGAALVGAGLILELQPAAWQPLVEIIGEITTLGSGELILGGLGLISGRRKLEEIDVLRRG